MLQEFAEFLQERHLIYLRRAAGHAAPWTDNLILREGSFTNVYRELDRTTRWLAANWREPNKEDPDLWFAMTVARNVNRIETLAQIGYPVPWEPNKFLDVAYKFNRAGKQIYSGAYMIRAGKTDGDIKAVYQVTKQFNPLWVEREKYRPQAGSTLESYWQLLLTAHGFGSFLAQQVVADLMYVEPLINAPDWNSFCAEGPGSTQGLNFVKGYPRKVKWKHAEFVKEVHIIQQYVNRRWEWEPLHAQNITNGLCEFSKYKKAQLGINTPRRKYRYA